MPQRTNDFQQLVDCIHRLFNDKNATFTTSAMISSKQGREKREVDLLVEYIDSQGKSIKIAIEAKDLSKKLKDESEKIDLSVLRAEMSPYTEKVKKLLNIKNNVNYTYPWSRFFEIEIILL